MVNILRFKLSDNVMESISQFAKTNQLTDRKVYKQEWNKWLELNDRMVNEEINRMNTLGYDNEKEDIKDKMFKAGRYYFRKKSMINDANEKTKTNTNTKREYIKLTNNILNMIDNHIQQNINNKNYTPANGYKQFCLNNISMLCQEKKDIGKKNIVMCNNNVFLEKIKKTYKNRHFIINQRIGGDK
jgi:hypothetical protein